MALNLCESDFNRELDHAEEIVKLLLDEIDKETGILANNREKVIDDRAYFIDYFREMHADEREDWLQMEHANLKEYDLTKTTIERYAKMVSSPFFGKVSFKDERTGKVSDFYLGLYGLMKDFKSFIVDWRAPVSELYYESEPGITSYKTPNGDRKGELTEKRRFSFENGVLKTAQDIKLPSDDDFLNEMLSSNSSDYLKVIVSTLQKDQNRIVRDYIDGVHVIAGCAGSGKSSIAMHKIAYIMYAFRDRLKNSHIIVLSPNDAFAGYISHILPDLGEENVDTLTQEQMIAALTSGSNIDFVSRDDSTERMLLSTDDKILKSVKFKNSDLFKQLVDKYIDWFDNNCFNPKDLYFNLDDNDILDQHISAKNIGMMFYDQLTDTPICDRVDKILEFICRKNHILNEEIKLDLKVQLEEMMTPLDMSVIYEDMFLNQKFIDTLPESLISQIGDIKDYLIKPFMWEDRVAVAYMMLDFFGTGYGDNIFYLFCDEAQDLSPLMIAILKKCYGASHMLFAGDISQNVFANSEDYAEVIKNYFPSKSFKKYELNVNYRSTKEISEFATGRTGRTNEISAVRQGPAPKLIVANGVSEAEIASAWLKDVNESGFERVAVVTATKQEADGIATAIDLPLRLNVKPYFLPVYLAKGLEFDAVLLVNTNGKMEQQDKKFGTNMFYTGCTRAMHDLTVIE